jgi:tetratricopeptide (TPR) repeat protein
MLSGCAASEQTKDKIYAGFLKKSSTAPGLIYASLKHDLESGRIMKARSKVLAMKQSDKDYARAHKLLKEKIEPARRRLFVHYLRKAKRAEANKLWSDAMVAYKQAKDVTIKPAVMENKRLKMEYKLRQLRFNILLKQRRREDKVLLANPEAYKPPRGTSPEDKVFYRKRGHYEDDLDDRAARAYREARLFLRRGIPEIAYIDIESYLRFQPDSDRGKKLIKEIREAIPRALTIPRARKIVQKAAVKNKLVKTRSPVKQDQAKRVAVSGLISAEQIQALLQRGELLSAKQYAQAYRREGGKDAAQLLAKIQRKIKREASDLFAKGGVAFRQEHLGRAIQYWSDAIALMPEEPEYVEALRRARQLEERLTLLRQAGDEKPVVIEE